MKEDSTVGVFGNVFGKFIGSVSNRIACAASAEDRKSDKFEDFCFDIF